MQKLVGIRIAVLRCGGQIGDGLFVILLDLFAIEIELSELVFRIVVSILRGNLKVTDRPEDILSLRFGESDLSDKICGKGILLRGSSFQVIQRTGNVLRNNLATIEELSHLILSSRKSFFSRVGKKSNCLGDVLQEKLSVEERFPKCI